MNTKENTIVIVLTKHAWITIYDGEILEEKALGEGSPLASYQSIYPKYNVVQLLQSTLKSKMMILVDNYFKSLEPKKVLQPKEQVSTVKQQVMPTRAQKRKAARIAKKEAASKIIEAKLIDPIKEQEQPKVEAPQQPVFEMIAPPLMITEKASTKPSKLNLIEEQVMKTININTEKAAAKSKVAGLTVIEVLFGTAHLIAQSTADVICYTEAQIINKMNVYDDNVEQLMAKRRKQTSAYQDVIMASPQKLKAYSQDHFTKLKEARAAKAAILKTKTA